MKKLIIILTSMLVFGFAATADAKHPERPIQAHAGGFYIANLSTKYSMKVTYEHCESRDPDRCELAEITLPAVDHGKNMQYVRGKYVFSVAKIDETGNQYPEAVFQFGCQTYSTEFAYTNMVGLTDIPGTDKLSCTPMLANI